MASVFRYFSGLRTRHDGSLTHLLSDRNQLDEAISSVVNSGIPKDDLLIVEYCQTADSAGMFRKYSAFCVNGKIIARHLLHGNDWVLKSPSVITEATVAEEEIYQSGNPHKREVGEIFKLANIDYGRIDYSLLDGKVVTWEINTNPLITVMPDKIAPLRMPGLTRFAALFTAEMRAIYIESRGPGIRVEMSPSLLRDAGMRTRDNLREITTSALRRIKRRLSRIF